MYNHHKVNIWPKKGRQAHSFFGGVGFNLQKETNPTKRNLIVQQIQEKSINHQHGLDTKYCNQGPFFFCFFPFWANILIHIIENQKTKKQYLETLKAARIYQLLLNQSTR